MLNRRLLGAGVSRARDVWICAPGASLGAGSTTAAAQPSSRHSRASAVAPTSADVLACGADSADELGLLEWSEYTRALGMFRGGAP